MKYVSTIVHRTGVLGEEDFKLEINTYTTIYFKK